MQTISWRLRCGVLTIALAGLAATGFGADEDGVISLFNGKDLTGWRGDKTRWVVEDGAITGFTTPDNLLKSNMFLILESRKPADFELRLKYKIVGGNSGVQYRSKVVDEEKFVVGGYQADIDSNPTGFTGINYEERGRQFLARRGQRVTIAADGTKQTDSFGDDAELAKKVKSEDWNEYLIVAKGPKLSHTINGTLMSEVIDNEPGKSSSSGVIAFQLHQGPAMKVQYKDIKLKELK